MELATSQVGDNRLVNPYYLLPIGSGFTAGALYGTTPSWIDLGGAFIIPPGGWIAFGALTAVTGFGGFLWEEIPNNLSQA